MEDTDNMNTPRPIGELYYAAKNNYKKSTIDESNVGILLW